MYTGAAGMAAQMHRMDILSNNLANVDLTGYKKDTAIHKSFPELLLRRTNDNGVYKFPFGSADTTPVVGKIGTGVELNESFTVFTQGSMKETGNSFDMALEGEGFFVIETPYGERYTRNGSFTLGKEGLLLTKEGYPVMGENGPIRIKKNNFIVDQDGKIYQNSSLAGDRERLVSLQENEWENIELVDRLRVVDFRRTRYLKKQGESLWLETRESGRPFTSSAENEVKVRQGFLESSNVNPVTAMVQMIEVNRAYEASQKVIQTHDSMTGRLINEAARL
jgi:flagellar basal-body rod protein FlgG